MDDLAACLRLILTQGIGPVAARRVANHFERPARINLANTTELKSAGLSDAQTEAFLQNTQMEAIETALAWVNEENHHIIQYNTPQYPGRLAELHDAPLLLFVVGDVDVLHTPQLAIVGSRKPTPSAARTAHDFARALALKGLTITSGLALGIDGEAHRGCIDADGLTVAVAATGLDRIYPAKHRDLAYQIVEQGAMISEFPLGTPVRAPYFTRRNRLISGLSIGTLVIEAAIRSGSLTTARHAYEQGREVLAIPGSIHNPLARGCHKLIRQGAKLVETADDVLEELAGQLGDFTFPEQVTGDDDKPVSANGELDPVYSKLLECVDYHPQGIDEIVSCSAMPPQEVASMILMLELNGLVESAGANRYVRRK